MGKLAVAYSGGADSTFLLKVAKDEVGDVAAIFVSGDISPAYEAEGAMAIARSIGAEPIIVHADVLSLPAFRENRPDRCYVCKRSIFSAIRSAAQRAGYDTVVDGTHAGDLETDRPGMRALREMGVRSPLLEAGLDKGDVRRLSKQLGLSTADKPASPCLATRIPFFDEITPGKLRQVESAERAVMEKGIRVVRVRHHGTVARIEVLPDDMATVLSFREDIVAQLKALGFAYVALDLQGFRSGSMSEPLKGSSSPAERRTSG
jgi:uncharacterized protein